MVSQYHTSVIIAIFNRQALLLRTLKGYSRYAPHQGTELIIADYGSTDGVEGLLPLARSVFPRVRYVKIDRAKSAIPINPKYNNPALALNVGAAVAEGSLLIMTPPECYPLADNIHLMQRITQLGKRDVCCFGDALVAAQPYGAIEDGILVEKSPSHTKGAIGEKDWFPSSEVSLRKGLPGSRFIWRVSKTQNKRSVPFFVGFPKRYHIQINGIDEEYLRGFGAEDTDYIHRLKTAGAEYEWDDRCIVFHQWHPTVPVSGARGIKEEEKAKKRDGLKANLGHEPGSRRVIEKEVIL